MSDKQPPRVPDGQDADDFRGVPGLLEFVQPDSRVVDGVISDADAAPLDVAQRFVDPHGGLLSVGDAPRLGELGGRLVASEPTSHDDDVWLRQLSDEQFDALNQRWFHEHGEERQDMAETEQ